MRKADVFLVIGTSLKVYPAAGLLHYVPYAVPKFLIDPEAKPDKDVGNLTLIREKATTGMEILKQVLKTLLK